MSVTPKLFATIRRMLQNGCGQISVSKKNASVAVHPAIARKLIKLGWAEYDRGGRGNTTVLVLTERGETEARIANERSENSNDNS